MFLTKIRTLFLLGIPLIISIWIYNNLEHFFRIAVFLFQIFIQIEDFINRIFIEKESEVLIIKTYDYIIVGAGTAGSLIAANLSSILNCTVLILEAGTYPSKFQKIPVLTPLFHRTQYDWKYKTESQLNSCGAMNNNQCTFPIGKGLGGSNLINNMIWHRGIKTDYNGWFENTTNYNYNKNIEPLFLNLEKKLKPKPLNYITNLGEILSKIGNINGVKFIKPLVLQNSGKRFTTYDYAKKVNPPNTIFFPNSLVLKINFKPNTLEAIGVTFERDNKIFTVYGKKGIILSAGAIGTPKLMLESGIGPFTELEKLNIKCLKNVPSVGKNLQDHIGTGMSLFQYNESLNMNIENILLPQNLFKYFNPFNFGNGPLSTVGCELLGFSNDNKIGYMFMPVDITSDYGSHLRHIMNIKDSIWEKYFKNNLLNIQTFSIIPILLHPKSKGSIKLIKIDSKYKVIINPNYLNEKDDIENLINGIELIKSTLLKISKTFGINLKFYEKKFPGCEHFNDTKDYWKCYLKQMSFSIYHPIGTCKMGSKTDINSSVVDYNFKVHNVNGLYIVDASVMPNLPSGNPNAAVALLTEKFLKKISIEKNTW